MVMLIVACLLSDPASCDKFRVDLLEEVTPQQCIVASQQILAEWQALHPDRHIERGRCVPVGRVGKDG